MTIHIGAKGYAQTVVTAANTAKAMGSGSLEVFATPAMVALMEQAAVNALELAEGQSSVGTSLTITHTAASPVGVKVTAAAELLEIDRRRLVFAVEASDEAGQIGAGKHERFIIDSEPFLIKARNRNQRS
ncbi:hotdog domain-containing protein [Desulfosporosinus sp. PR]|uniref:thioesterase family protein n=1 Tax=Candidatus Desulfosporosinus nitrosoreducens TaxID=3401928 RepID=UPI0027E6EAD4|nr:hotdog domain-containing protein [Desulfosporosinus sp. PR]MDQ7096038.1 hotdog domain-containing protein [Desulfosporosinus sp. PR]